MNEWKRHHFDDQNYDGEAVKSTFGTVPSECSVSLVVVYKHASWSVRSYAVS